jgi:hypothetical protein
MRPSLSLAKQHVQEATPALLPVALVIFYTLSATKTPFHHSLFAKSIAWLLVCIYHGARLRLRAGAGDARKRTLSWLAGLLYALAQVCDRAAAENEGVWWAKVRYIPVFKDLRLPLDANQMTVTTPARRLSATPQRLRQRPCLQFEHRTAQRSGQIQDSWLWPLTVDSDRDKLRAFEQCLRQVPYWRARDMQRPNDCLRFGDSGTQR